MPRKKAGKLFRVGVDSYSLRPLKLDPFALLDWVKKRGGGQHIPFNWETGRPIDIFTINRRAADLRYIHSLVKGGEF
jgi:hypothetical protein